MGSLEKVTTDEALAQVGRGRPQAPRLGRAGRVRARAEDRRLGDLARLRGRAARPGRHARRRHPRGGRHASTCARSARSRSTLRGDAPPLMEVRGEVYFPLSGFRALQRASRSPRARRPRRTPATPPRARCGSSTRGSRRRGRSPCGCTAPATGKGSRPTRTSRRSPGCASAGSARTRSPSGWSRSRRSQRPAPRGSAGAPSSTTRSTGSSIKVDSFDQQARLGALHERPRWARAYKWAPLTAETKLLQIAIRVGRTGALNPWAMLEPVNVGGVTVSRATLHNEEDINRKEIREGDIVIVQRAGDVIPQVVGPAGPHAKGTKEFRMPERCPLCDAEIVKPEGEVMHRCPNRACPSRGLETLINWVTAAMDIEGVGEQFVRRLWDEGLLRSMPDLYRLTPEQLMELEGLRRDLRRERGRRDRALEAAAVLARPLRPQHPRRRLGDRAATSPATSAPSTRCSTRARRRSRRSRGSGPTGPRRSRSGSRTSRTATLVAELRELGLRFEVGEEERPVEGPLSGQPVRDHGHARVVLARGGEGGARGARRQGLRQRLEEDDRRHRRREPRLEGREGGEGRRADPLGGGAQAARKDAPRRRRRCVAQPHGAGVSPRRAPSRSGPGRCAPSRSRSARPFWRIAKT